MVFTLVGWAGVLLALLLTTAASEPIVFLDEYRSEELGGIELLWDPRFDADPDLRARIDEAIRADLAHLDTSEPLDEVRIVVTVHGPELEAFPPGGNGLWRWSGAAWLTAAGLDAERAGAIEIWGAERYLVLSRDHPDLLTQNVLRSLAPPAHPLLPDLDHYTQETLGDFVVLWHEDLDPELQAALREALDQDLGVIAERIPSAALDALRGTRFIVNGGVTYSSGTKGAGRYYHVDPAWFEQHGLDAGRVGSVEIYDGRAWLEERPDHPMGLLHELAHKRVAQASGEVRAQLSAAYARALESGDYESVPYALGGPDARASAYALTSEGEYAAELSEAWFGRNEYHPFTRAELEAADPQGALLVRELWAVPAAVPDDGADETR